MSKDDEFNHRGSQFLRRIFQVIVPVVVLGLSYSVYSYFTLTKPERKQRPKVEASFTVKTIPVKIGRIQPTIELFGRTSSGRKVDLRALVSGQVIEMGKNFRDGALIKKGDLLLQIDPFDYRGAVTEAKAQLKEAAGKLSEFKLSLAAEGDALKRDKQALDLAMTDADRARQLVRRGTVSQKTVDDRQTVVTTRQQSLEQKQNNLKVWAAKIEQQEATLDRLRWSVEKAERRLSETRLVAPFEAYVDDANAEMGRTLSANDSVATLFDQNSIDVAFTLTDQQYGRIVAAEKSVLGRTIDVLWRVGNSPIKYTAVVDRVDAQINSNAGGVQVYARIKEPTKTVPLRPGAFVEVQVPDKSYADVMMLPVTALYDNNTVYLNVDGRLQSRKVELVGASGKDVIVRGSLADGEQVVVTRLSTPSDGLKVEGPSSRPRGGGGLARRGGT